MNLFAIDENPRQAARWLVDAHCPKMLLEAAQMFCTNFHLQGIDAPYRVCYSNHPSTRWLRTSYENFLWGLEHAYEIAAEYTARYGKRHKSEDVLDWVEANSWRLDFPSQEQTPFALAISEDAICRTLPEFDSLSEVQKYREYYKLDKAHIHSWKRNRPEWL
jgi:hypothetical protein